MIYLILPNLTFYGIETHLERSVALQEKDECVPIGAQ